MGFHHTKSKLQEADAGYEIRKFSARVPRPFKAQGHAHAKQGRKWHHRSLLEKPKPMTPQFLEHVATSGLPAPTPPNVPMVGQQHRHSASAALVVWTHARTAPRRRAVGTYIETRGQTSRLSLARGWSPAWGIQATSPTSRRIMYFDET